MMSKCLAVLLIAGATSLTAQAATPTSETTKPKIVKKKAAPAKKAVPAAAAEPQHSDDDDGVPDTASSTVSEFHCELGNKVTLYHNADDEKHIGLRWKKALHRLTRVSTSTGANRFENRKFGLVWIGIPAKSMLLDSKKGLQLANECKTAEQAVPQKAILPEPPAAPEATKS